MKSALRSAPRESGRAYYFRTISHAELIALREAFYCARRKIVPRQVLNEYLTPLALAAWIMDDGSADGSQLRINTQSFSIQECEELADTLFRKFGLAFSLNTDKGRPRLRCRARSMPQLLDLIGPHLLPEMRYKLPA